MTPDLDPVPTRDLPDDPSLEQLRKQAREHQRATPGLTLALAQLATARSYGFRSWTALKRQVELVRSLRRAPDELGPQDDPAREFLRLACLSYGADDLSHPARAKQVLEAHPGIAHGDVHVAAARCDADELARLLAADPRLATREGGPQAWVPLVHLAYARPGPEVSEADAVRSARLLLDAGADPDSGYLWHGLPSPFTALTGIFGEGEGGPDLHPRHPHEVALARVLLEEGADANDSQTLYNRMFPRRRHPPRAALRVRARAG